MSKPKGNSPRRTIDMGARALAEYLEAERRRYHADIRRQLIERGAISVPRATHRPDKSNLTFGAKRRNDDEDGGGQNFKECAKRIVDRSVEKLLEEAAPRFKAKGWKVGERKEER